MCSVVSVGTFRSSKSYVSKLEQQLKAEIERRTQLELEIQEMKKINEKIAKKMGV